jgi:hypothetical protein
MCPKSEHRTLSNTIAFGIPARQFLALGLSAPSALSFWPTTSVPVPFRVLGLKFSPVDLRRIANGGYL